MEAINARIINVSVKQIMTVKVIKMVNIAHRVGNGRMNVLARLIPIV